MCLRAPIACKAMTCASMTEVSSISSTAPAVFTFLNASKRDRPPMDLVIRNAKLRDRKESVDIGVTKDRITAVEPKLASKGAKEIDAAGSLVLPGMFNLHFHADKCLLGEIM